MLDQDDGDAVIGQQSNQPFEILDLAMDETCRRLIQQQNSRPQGERTGYFQSPLMTERKVARLLLRKVGKSYEFQELVCLAEEPVLLAAEAWKSEQSFRERIAVMRVKPGHHVLEHAHLPKQFRILECPRDPLPRELMARQRGNARAEECDSPLGWNIESGDQVQEGGF